jgi:hypothetical protein
MALEEDIRLVFEKLAKMYTVKFFIITDFLEMVL